MTRLEKRKKTMIGTAAITVMAVVFSQFFYYEAASFSKTEVKKEQQANQKVQQNEQTDLPDNPSDHQTYISLQSTTLPSSTVVVLHQVMFFLFEIQFEERESPSADFRIFLPPNRFFKTLFDSVISPNAP